MRYRRTILLSAGAVLVAALALATELGLWLVERALMPRGIRLMRRAAVVRASAFKLA